LAAIFRGLNKFSGGSSMKKRIRMPWPFFGILALICALTLAACQLENKADITVMEASFSEDFIQVHEDLEFEVQAVVQTARDQVMAGVTWTEVRPNTGVEACCWAHGTASSLAPDDEGARNTYGDNCLSTAAVDGSNSSWWNMNYMRSAASPTLNKRHGNKNTNDGGNHWITLDLGAVYNISGFGYMGRNGNGNSRINAYQIFVSEEEDLGRDPADKNTGDHPGHRPSPAKLVHQGNFANSQDMQQITFSMPAYGRYVQLRVLTSFNDSGNDGGAAELRVTREETASGASLTAAVNAGVAAALTENNYDTLTIDNSFLAASYQDGIQVLGTVKNNPVKFNRLNTLLHGSLGSDGEILVKGAKQYLEDDPDRPAIESDVDAYFEYQNEVDDITRQIRLLLSALQGPSNS
jgi:hypothetical protein